MLEGKGRVWKRKAGREAVYIYIPKAVSSDSRFPFKHCERVIVKILPANEMVVIKKEGESHEDNRGN